MLHYEPSILKGTPFLETKIQHPFDGLQVATVGPQQPQLYLSYTSR